MVHEAMTTGDRSVMDLAVVRGGRTTVVDRVAGTGDPDESGVATDCAGSARASQRACTNEAALLASEARYRVLADLNPHAIWMGDADGNITYANQGFLSYIGLSLEQLGAEGWLHVFAPADRARVARGLEALSADG